jgi:hypothetical protein
MPTEWQPPFYNDWSDQLLCGDEWATLAVGGTAASGGPVSLSWEARARMAATEVFGRPPVLFRPLSIRPGREVYEAGDLNLRVVVKCYPDQRGAARAAPPWTSSEAPTAMPVFRTLSR